MFAIEPIADFCPILGYWPSKTASREYNVMGEFVSLAKPIVLCTIGKRISCWSIFEIELKADFCPFLGYGYSNGGSHDHNVKGESMVFGIVGKIISFRLFFSKYIECHPGSVPPLLEGKKISPPPNFSHSWVPRILISRLKWNFSSVATFKT